MMIVISGDEQDRYDLKASPYLWLFLDLFTCDIKEGTISQFRQKLSNSVAHSTKYRFLNSMVHYGVLRVSGNKAKPWGLNEVLMYNIDKGRLYNIFINTPFGMKLRRVFSENSVMFDGFF